MNYNRQPPYPYLLLFFATILFLLVLLQFVPVIFDATTLSWPEQKLWSPHRHLQVELLAKPKPSTEHNHHHHPPPPQQQQQRQQQQPQSNNHNHNSANNNKTPKAITAPFVNTTKTLVIVTGNLRGGESAWNSLHQNVLEYNPNTDLALMIGETKDNTTVRGAAATNASQSLSSSSLFQWAKYHWTFPEYSDWADAIDLIHGTQWRRSVFPRLKRHRLLWGGAGPFREFGSGAVVFMIRWFVAQKILELELTNQYDRFVITRSDHYYLCPHDLSLLDNEHLWVPEGEDYFGITDRHLIVPAEHVVTSLDVMSHILSNPALYEQNWTVPTKQGATIPKPANAERALLRRLEYGGIAPLVRKFPRCMFVCAVPGDPTRWKAMNQALGAVEGGVFRKYEKEYKLAKQTCRGSRKVPPNKKAIKNVHYTT